MAITINPYVLDPLPAEGAVFYKSQYSADVSGAEKIVAGATNKRHYITKIHLRCATELNFTLGSGISAGSIVHAHIGPIHLDAASGIFVWKAPDGFGLRCDDEADFAIDASAAGPIWVETHGKTCLIIK